MANCDGWIGRRIFGYFNKSGLFDGFVDCFNKIETEFLPGTQGFSYVNDMRYFVDKFITEDEYNEWVSDISRVYERGEYLFCAPYFVYFGVKR